MTIQQLEYILEVHRCGTIAQAAKNLFVTHSCISNAIRTLEEELGFAVFERSWQGAVPTRQGATVLEHAKTICEHQKLILQSTQEIRTIRIETGLNALFSEAFVCLLDEYRDCSNTVFCHQQNRSIDTTGSQSPEERLLSFETEFFADLVQGEGSRLTLHKRTARQRGLAFQLRGTIPAAVYIGARHPLYGKQELTLSDLADDCLVDTPKALLAKSGMIRRKLGFSPARTLLASENGTRLQLVEAGHGFYFGARLPGPVCSRHSLRSIPVPEFQYHLAVMTNPARPISPEGQRYLELLDGQIAQLQAE